MGTSSGAERGGREFQRVEDALRRLLANGTYRRGDNFPTQRELAADLGVSRDTVQRVLRLLNEEGLVSSRQGSGIKVLQASSTGRPGRVTLGPVINAAFERSEVTLDVYTLTSETLVKHIGVQAERIVGGEIDAPDRVSVRMLLPSRDAPLAYPGAADPADLRVWERFLRIARDREEQMRELFAQLSATLEVKLEIRTVPLTPQFKLYVFNNSEMLFSPYEIIEKGIQADDGSGTVPARDVLGLTSNYTYFRRDQDEGSRDSQFFSSMQDWFESNWNILGGDGIATG